MPLFRFSLITGMKSEFYIQFQIINQMENLPDDQIEKAFKIMEMLGIDFDEAANLLVSCNYSVERVMQRNLSPMQFEQTPSKPMSTKQRWNAGGRRKQTQKQSLEESILQSHGEYHAEDHYVSQNIDYANMRYHTNFPFPETQSNQHQLSKPKHRKEPIQKIDFRKTYLIKKKDKNKSKNKPKVRKSKRNQKPSEESAIQPEISFQAELEKMIGSHEASVDFRDDFMTALEQIWQKKLILAVHVLNFLKKSVDTEKDISVSNLKKFYSDSKITIVLNTHFINFGLESSNFELEEQFKELINYSEDQNSIIFLRVNTRTNQLEVLKKLKLIQFFRFKKVQSDEFSKEIYKIKQVEQACIIQQMHNYESKEDVYLLYPLLNPEYKEPKKIQLTSEEEKKIAEDKILKEDQEMLFNECVQVCQENANIELNQRQTQQKKDDEQRIKRIRVTEQRNFMRQSLLTYEANEILDPIVFKLKLPSGQIINVTLPQEETPEYLFKLIESEEREVLGLENQWERQFNIVRPIDRLSLEELRAKSFKEIFEGSNMETLVVRDT